MSGPDIQVSPSTVHQVAGKIDKDGENLRKVAGQMQAKEMHGSHRGGDGASDAFGLAIAESAQLGVHFTDLLNMLAAYGELLGDTLQHAAEQMHTMGTNYTDVDDSMAN